jgi:uncharacterized protein YqgC (DUF456 family)
MHRTVRGNRSNWKFYTLVRLRLGIGIFIALELDVNDRHLISPHDERRFWRPQQLHAAATINHSMDTVQAYYLLATLLVLAGLAGLILPALPGSPLIFAGLFVAAWAEDFTYVGLGTLIVLAVLAVLTYAIDFWATMFGARRFGASKRAVIGALIGAIVGLFLGLPGVIFGPFIGAVIGELSARRGLQDAARAGFGATIGLAIGVAVKMAVAFSMIGIFIFARFL